MIWFFERETACLRYEIRREMEGAGYELVIIEDGGERVERVQSANMLLERSHLVWAGLLQKGWRPVGPALPPAV